MPRQESADLAAAIEAFLVSERRDGKAAVTLVNYRADLLALLRSMGPRPRTGQVAQAAVRHLGGLQLAERSWNRHLSTLRRFCQFMVEADLLPRNPLRMVERASVSEQAPRTASARDLRAVMVRVRSARDQALIALLCDQGLRIREALELRKGDVDVERGTLTIGGDPARRHTLGQRARELLKRYLEKHLGGPSDPLFISRRMHPLSYAAAHRSFRRYAGDTGLTLRHLRASAAAAAFDRGASLAQVQAMLGHLHAASTARYRNEGRPSEQPVEPATAERNKSLHPRQSVSK